MLKKIGVVTATRAEYGLLRRIIQEIWQDAELELQLLVTGTHLCRDFGYTVQEIEADGFPITARIPIMEENGENCEIKKNEKKETVTDIMAKAMQLFGRFFENSRTDLLVLLGDRYELIPIAMAAISYNIPIAHINGGEITEGAIDDTVRHCLTKMSCLHFTACEEYAKRVIQLGEQPQRVFNYGDTGVENIEKIEPVSREELEERIGMELGESCASVTFHPVTREEGTAAWQVSELLEALSAFPEMRFVITMANADEGGREINTLLLQYAQNHDNVRVFASLGVRYYISLLHYADMIIGNSSSGIIEAPSIGIPTVNIGNRQRGRLQAQSIINCSPHREEIVVAVRKAGSDEMKRLAAKKKNPYAGGDTSHKIVETIKTAVLSGKIELMKRFYDLDTMIDHNIERK